MKVGIDGLGHDPRGFHQHQAGGADRAGNPCSDAVAGDIPAVRQRISVAKPTRRGQHRQAAALERGGDVGGVPRQCCAAQTGGEQMRGTDPSPIWPSSAPRLTGQGVPAIDVADRVRKRTTARDDQQPARTCGPRRQTPRARRRCGLDAPGARRPTLTTTSTRETAVIYATDRRHRRDERARCACPRRGAGAISAGRVDCGNAD